MKTIKYRCKLCGKEFELRKALRNQEYHARRGSILVQYLRCPFDGIRERFAKVRKRRSGKERCFLQSMHRGPRAHDCTFHPPLRGRIVGSLRT